MALLYLVDKIRENKSTAFINSIFIIDIILLILLLNGIGITVSYGLYGVMLPVVIYLFYNLSFRKRIIMWCIVAIMMILQWLSYFITIQNISTNSFVELFALLAIPLLCLYNGQRGKFNLKWLFYTFYPTHILLIYLISLLL